MQDVLDNKVALVSLAITIFGGYRRATREHIAALGGSLPASKAVTEGSIKVFPNEATKDLHSIRRQVFRTVSAKGIRALGSHSVYALPAAEVGAIETAILDAKAEFTVVASALDQDYETVFERHVADNPEAATIIRSLKVERAAALAKCQFSHKFFKIVPIGRPGDADEGVADIVRGLGRQLFEEVAEEMARFADNAAFTRQRVGQKSLRPIKAVVAKMRGLAFLDPAADGAIALVQDTLASLPQHGYIEGAPFVSLQRLIELMSDADSLVNAASRVANGARACDVLLPPPPPLVEPPALPGDEPAQGGAGQSGAVAFRLPEALPPQLPGLPQVPVSVAPPAVRKPLRPAVLMF